MVARFAGAYGVFTVLHDHGMTKATLASSNCLPAAIAKQARSMCHRPLWCTDDLVDAQAKAGGLFAYVGDRPP